MKPICIPCQRFFRPRQNGYYFIEGMPVEHPSLPGTQEPEKWAPYKVWSGDMWECEGCHARIIVGVGLNAIREQFHKDFHQTIEDLGANQLQVNDC